MTGFSDFCHTCYSFLGVSLLLLLGAGQASGDVPVIEALDSYNNTILNSGGVLLAEQAAYDVQEYDIDLYVDPSDQSLHGSVITRVAILDKTDKFVAHLDTVFTTHRVMWILADGQTRPLDFSHDEGLIVAQFDRYLNPGDSAEIEITYSGKPRPAPNPPWEGGVTWAETDDGAPWIAVSCQMNGADVWWPVKDHPSDRPNSVSMRITVPEGLVALSNGTLLSVEKYSNDTRTYHWRTRNPISNYAVTMNIGPYITLQKDFKSVTGEIFPIYFWALPYHKEKAMNLMSQIVDHLDFFESLLGPYPFRNEKYGVVESPYLGMEHQTLVAYGAGFENDVVFQTDSGYDDLHHHELAHEWWGNLVAVYDWRDFWIHEGFGTYMQPLYAEELHGKQQYRYFMQKLYERIENNIPIAPHGSKTTREMFDGRDIYMKGAWVLHTLRKLIGDEDFFKSLRLMLYPDPGYEEAGAPAPSRLVDTRTYIDLVESITGHDLEWFFDAYLRYAELPELQKRWDGNDLYLSWRTPSGKHFPMPVEIYDGTKSVQIKPDPETPISVQDRRSLKIDPKNRVLRKGMFSLER